MLLVAPILLLVLAGGAAWFFFVSDQEEKAKVRETGPLVPAPGIVLGGVVAIATSDTGKVETIAVGPARQNDETVGDVVYEEVVNIPIAVVNWTQDTIHSVQVNAVVRSDSGEVLEGSEEVTVTPWELPPRTWGIAMLEVKNVKVSEIGSVDYSTSYEDGSCPSFCPAFAYVPEWNFSDGSRSPNIRGVATASVEMTSQPFVTAVCFDESGTEVSGTMFDSLAASRLSPGQSSAFVLRNRELVTCRNFALYVISYS